MRLIFSLLLLVSFNGYAFVINIYTYQDIKNALIVKKIFNTKYQIPPNLISIRKDDCNVKVDRRMINLCLTKKGKLVLLPSNIKFQRNSLQIFRTSQKEVQNVL